MTAESHKTGGEQRMTGPSGQLSVEDGEENMKM